MDNLREEKAAGIAIPAVKGLRGIIKQLDARSSEAAASQPALNAKEIERLKGLLEKQSLIEEFGKKQLVWSNLDVQLYEYVKLDAAHDTSRSSVGNFARWVLPDQDDNQLNPACSQSEAAVKSSKVVLMRLDHVALEPRDDQKGNFQ